MGQLLLNFSVDIIDDDVFRGGCGQFIILGEITIRLSLEGRWKKPDDQSVPVDGVHAARHFLVRIFTTLPTADP